MTPLVNWSTGIGLWLRLILHQLGSQLFYLPGIKGLDRLPAVLRSYNASISLRAQSLIVRS